MALNAISFFGDVDKIKSGENAGKTGSTFPSWYFTGKVEDLQDSINALKRRLEDEGATPVVRRAWQRDLQAMEKRLDNINQSRPTIEGADKDELNKALKELKEEIMSSNYSRDDMVKGRANAGTQWRVNVGADPSKLIKVPKALAKACGIQLERGGDPHYVKLSRNAANRCWKIGRKYLGEDPNTGLLRK